MKAKEFLIRTGKLLSAVLFLSVAGCGLAQAALHVSVKIPVPVRVSGNAPEESYKVVIERDPSNPNAPVASPSELTVTGSGEKEYNLSFEEMTYTASGSYRYLIKQVPGEKSNFTYDNSVYAVLVTVGEYDVDSAHNPVPPYLSAVYSAGKEGSLTKLGEIAFNNQYSRGTTPNGGGGGGTPPRPTPSSPNPKIPTVEGENRPMITTPEVKMRVPDVLGVIRQVATGDGSVMALYGCFAVLSMASLLFWGIGQRKKQKKHIQ